MDTTAVFKAVAYEADEYDAYDFSEYTAEELSAVDAALLSSSPAHAPPPAARADALLASSSTARQYATATKAKKRKRKNKGEGQADALSPYARHRLYKKTLSVSDLAGPAWCELQYDYGLRQGRGLKLAQRPDSFVSGKGKVIAVETAVAKKREKTQNRGKVIHKRLERELRPVDVEIKADTESERWALKLLQMNACLEDLLVHKFCREMPVFGLLNDQLVIGVIDEIRTSTALPLTLDSKTSHTLYISDSKTRIAPTLPSEADARPSRLQLMMYHRLLSGVLASKIDWPALWARLELDPTVPFSDEFLKKTGLQRARSQPPSDEQPAEPSADKPDEDVYVGFPRTLDDLADALSTALDAVPHAISPTLEIVYRAQQHQNKTRHILSASYAGDRASDASAASSDSEEAEDAGTLGALAGEDVGLQRAIAASLEQVVPQEVGFGASGMGESIDAVMPAYGAATLERDAGSLERASAVGLESSSAIDGFEETRTAEDAGARAVDYLATAPAEIEAVPMALDATPAELAAAPAEPDQAPSDGDGKKKTPKAKKAKATPAEKQAARDAKKAGRVIGRTPFAMDAGALDAHLARTLDWWHGRRAPAGVPLELSRRCFSCEYREGCEWREAEAHRIAERYGVAVEDGSADSASASGGEEFLSASEGAETLDEGEERGKMRKLGGEVDVASTMF